MKDDKRLVEVNFNPRGARWLLTIGLAVVAVFFGYATLTLPAISATAPAILFVASVAGTYFAWPKSK